MRKKEVEKEQRGDWGEERGGAYKGRKRRMGLKNGRGGNKRSRKMKKVMGKRKGKLGIKEG